MVRCLLPKNEQANIFRTTHSSLTTTKQLDALQANTFSVFSSRGADEKAGKTKCFTDKPASFIRI